ncbi:MAG: hypothetical protein GY708_02850 [Actinomycetia bacterium]|nr:hypothetical protein [Actinomycetes bacterium]
MIIMNADASSPVTAEPALGAAPSDVVTIAWITLWIGIAALIGGGLLLHFGFRDQGVRTVGNLPGPRS